MGSGSAAGLDSTKHGVIPRAVDQIFETLEAGPMQEEWNVRVSYLEIYNEEVKDLLYPRTPTKSITIREDSAGDIFVHGAQGREARRVAARVGGKGSGCAWSMNGVVNNKSRFRSGLCFTALRAVGWAVQG